MVIKVQQVRSAIRFPKIQSLWLKSLGLGKIGRIVEISNTPQNQGLIRKVSHLIRVSSE